jgi:hypothetical protein
VLVTSTRAVRLIHACMAINVAIILGAVASGGATPLSVGPSLASLTASVIYLIHVRR